MSMSISHSIHKILDAHSLDHTSRDAAERIHTMTWMNIIVIARPKLINN